MRSGHAPTPASRCSVHPTATCGCGAFALHGPPRWRFRLHPPLHTVLQHSPRRAILGSGRPVALHHRRRGAERTHPRCLGHRSLSGTSLRRHAAVLPPRTHPSACCAPCVITGGRRRGRRTLPARHTAPFRAQRYVALHPRKSLGRSGLGSFSAASAAAPTPGSTLLPPPMPSSGAVEVCGGGASAQLRLHPPSWGVKVCEICSRAVATLCAACVSFRPVPRHEDCISLFRPFLCVYSPYLHPPIPFDHA